jgi:hypothetical protein
MVGSSARPRRLAKVDQSCRHSSSCRERVTVACGCHSSQWYTSPAKPTGYELVAARMLIMAAGHEGKPLDGAVGWCGVKRRRRQQGQPWLVERDSPRIVQVTLA